MNGTRSICFMMPRPFAVPIGGYKVVYEYVNRFAADGWDVTVVYPIAFNLLTEFKDIIRHPRSKAGFFYEKLQSARVQRRQRQNGSFWFKLDSRVRWLFPWQVTHTFLKTFPSGTRFVATFFTTARLLHDLRAPHTFQFIQDRENWFGVTLDEIYETYRYPMTKIVISRWLEECVKEAGESSVYIPNGLDFTYFKQMTPPESRSRFEVAMLWHDTARKRTMDAFRALAIVQKKHPELHVTAFGVPDKPANLPDWFTYIQMPDKAQHNQIYNQAAIFIASSEQEGWGLCPSEAMICGAAVACTDIGGYRSFAVDGVNALMSPVYNVEALAENTCRLIEDNDLRLRLARAGHESIQQFTWENSFAQMERLMEEESD